MRRPIKPFAVETRRTGRKPPSPRTSLVEEEKPSKPQVEWPPMPGDEDDSYAAALRAADALFSRPPAEPAESETAARETEAEPQRRILQSLDEQDHISRLLAEEEAKRPRRGRKPREEGAETLPMEHPQASPAPPAPAADPSQAEDAARPGGIPGYVRGHIFSRYARHDSARPGENWRKRSFKPLW